MGVGYDVHTELNAAKLKEVINQCHFNYDG